jgi:AbrB family looped-hinge helix DNA binding protein
MTAYTVGAKGQIVIAKEIRKRLGVKPGWIALQQEIDGHLVVNFVPPEHSRSLKGALAHYVTDENRIGDKDWNEVREEAWAEAIRERFADPDKA